MNATRRRLYTLTGQSVPAARLTLGTLAALLMGIGLGYLIATLTWYWRL